jgi:hypothetical protein
MKVTACPRPLSSSSYSPPLPPPLPPRRTDDRIERLQVAKPHAAKPFSPIAVLCVTLWPQHLTKVNREALVAKPFSPALHAAEQLYFAAAPAPAPSPRRMRLTPMRVFRRSRQWPAGAVS